MFRSHARTLIAACAFSLLAACSPAPPSSTAAPSTGPLTVPGTSVLIADAAAFASTACGLKAPTDALLTGIATAAVPAATLPLLGVEGVGNLLCAYRAAVVAATPAVPTPPAAPAPAPAPVPATPAAVPPAAITPATSG
jgi:hypothetical protein